MSNFLVIDASLLDGGGDILWRSLSFSAAIGVPVRIIKIRVGYKLKRGLWEIDIKAIHLLSQMCEAQMKGVSIGSTVIEFIPRAINGGRYMIDTMSDSSITNVLQLVLPAALLSKNRVVLELKGATNIPGFPHIDYIAEVFKGILEKFGGNIDLQLHRRGYHKGGGHATVTINPVAKFDSVTLTEMGAVELIYGLSYISGEYTIEVARLIAATFTKEVQNITNNVALDCYRETKTVAANASGITAICKTSGGCIMGACAVGRRKVDAEAVGKAAAVELLTPLANFSCVDRHAQDRVIMFMALAEGKSRIRVHKVTPKTQNAMYVATTFTDGGQILRMSVAFSAVMGIPIRVIKIRAGRSKPGLAAQHLKGIQLVGQMCQAKLNGVEIGSTEIEFIPGVIRGGNYLADTKTAGSISLLLQVALPCALLANERVVLDLKGGTNADMAPQIDYMTEVFRPVLEKFGATFDFDLHRRGYFPKGGGHVTVTTNPVSKFNSVNLTEMGRVEKIYGWSFVAGTLPIKLAYQMADAFKRDVEHITRNINIECYKEDREIAPDNCSGIITVCETSTGCILGSDGLGKRGVEAAAVGRAAAADLTTPLAKSACLDRHAQDQVILFMALAEGRSRVRVDEVTLHTKTAMHIATILTDVKFDVISEQDTFVIECTGLGFFNKNLASR